MNDIKYLRENPEEASRKLSRRKEKIDISKILEIDKKRREILFEYEKLKSEQNFYSKQIPIKRKNGDSMANEIKKLKILSDKIAEIEKKIRVVEFDFNEEMLLLPNIPNDLVPGDKSEDVEIRKWGSIPNFDFEALPHWEIAKNLGLFDQIAAGKTSGSKFVFYKDVGARLERAITNFFLDTHTQKNNYIEVFPPFIVSRKSMTGVGQLPKFEDDAFKVLDSDNFLIPTAEVPVTNMHRSETFREDELPIKYVAYSACFRSEAGSARRDTRGIIRQHQFNKVELVKLVKPKNSYEELEGLVHDAESVLKALGLPYRVVNVSILDLGFQAAMKYDLEVWMPSYNKYVEISSCSNFEAFQSRRINIKYKSSVSEKKEFVHTLNGSGLAVGRTFAAIVENFQTKEGNVIIPDVLVPYMSGVNKIEKK